MRIAILILVFWVQLTTCFGHDDLKNIEKWISSNSNLYKRTVDEIKKKNQTITIQQSTEIKSSIKGTKGTKGRYTIIVGRGKSFDSIVETIVIETGNAFFQPQFDSIDQMAKEGKIRSPESYALAKEIVEYQSVELSAKVFAEINTNREERKFKFLFNKESDRLLIELLKSTDL